MPNNNYYTISNAENQTLNSTNINPNAEVYMQNHNTKIEDQKLNEVTINLNLTENTTLIDHNNRYDQSSFIEIEETQSTTQSRLIRWITYFLIMLYMATAICGPILLKYLYLHHSFNYPYFFTLIENLFIFPVAYAIYCFKLYIYPYVRELFRKIFSRIFKRENEYGNQKIDVNNSDDNLMQHLLSHTPPNEEFYSHHIIHSNYEEVDQKSKSVIELEVYKPQTQSYQYNVTSLSNNVYNKQNDNKVEEILKNDNSEEETTEIKKQTRFKLKEFTRGRYYSQVGPFAIALGVQYLLAVIATKEAPLRLLSVLRATQPLLTALFLLIFCRVKTPTSIWIILACIGLGSAFDLISVRLDNIISLFGVVLALSSIVFTVIRSLFAERALTSYSFLTLILFAAPISTLVCLIAFLFSPEFSVLFPSMANLFYDNNLNLNSTSENALDWSWEVIVLVLIISVIDSLMVIWGLGVIEYTSAVSQSVAAAVSRPISALLAMFIFSEFTSILSLIGMSVTFCASALYTYFKYR